MGNGHVNSSAADLTWTGEFPDQEADSLKTAVIFSDRIAATKAMEIHRWVLQQVKPNCPITTTWWDVEWLKEKELFEASLRQASQADILLVAIPVAGNFSGELKKWLSAVLKGNSQGERALIAVLAITGESQPGCTAVEAYLHDQAERAGVDYFPHRYTISEPTTESGTTATTHPIVASAQQVSRDPFAYVQGVQHWGINE